MPHGTFITRGNANGFDDISSTGQKLTFPRETDDDSATLPSGFPTVLFGTQVGSTIKVATNGYLVFGPHTNDDNFVGQPLPNPSMEAFAVAPYWADLNAVPPDGGVYWQIKDAGTGKVLIVQWDKMRTYDTNEEGVTFQAKIYDTGQLDFEYRAMPTGAVSSGTGAQGPSTAWGFGTTASANSGVTLFGPATRPVTVPAVVPGTVTGTFVLPNGTLDRASYTFNSVVNSRELVVTEVMARSTAPQGEWLEISNRTPVPADLSSWTLQLSGGRNVPLMGVVPAYGSAVYGQSTDPAQNGDAGVTYALTGLSLNDANETMRLSRVVNLTQLSYGGASDAGTARVFDRGPFIGRNGQTFNNGQVCEATAPYSSTQLGTPGRETTCGFGYVLQSVPGQYFEIASTGTRLFNTPTGTSQAALTFPSGAPPPVLFGMSYPSLYVNINGWVSPNNSTSSGNANKLEPSTTAPVGTLAVYWDDLLPRANVTPASDVYWKRVAANEDPRVRLPHWIIEWKSVIRDDPNTTRDDMNFQVKFFDDGVIEYHYGRMDGTYYDARSTGTRATVWLENPGGTLALPICIESDCIASNSGYRFSPR